MQATKKITTKDWMTDHKTTKIMTLLGGSHDSIQSLFVGGCVRNTLLGFPVVDVDIATKYHPDEVLKILDDNGIKAIPTGIDHGTVTAIMDDQTFEITTLRKDVDTDGRHAVVSFTQDWVEDAMRRDFTINTLLMDLNGNIYDPTGAGLKDLDHGRVVFVGDADKRIVEDYLRILRFFRFYGTYGQGKPDENALDAIKKHADKIAGLSKERITQEFLKILELKNVSDVLNIIVECGVLKNLHKDFVKDQMELLVSLQNNVECHDVFSRLLLFCGFDIKRAHSALSLSNAQKKEMENISKCLNDFDLLDLKNMRRAIYWYGNIIATQTYLLTLVLKGGTMDNNLLDVAKYWVAPVFPITGNDLMEKGYTQGLELGAKLKELEEEWIERDFKDVPKF